MLRVNDTRIYHDLGKDYLLREYTSREAKVEDIQVRNIDSILSFYQTINHPLGRKSG